MVAMVLATVMVLLQILAAVPTGLNVYASPDINYDPAITYTEEALFNLLPEYLSDAESTRNTNEYFNAAYDVLQSTDGLGEFITAFLHSVADDGISETIRDKYLEQVEDYSTNNGYGSGLTTYERFKMDAANQLVILIASQDAFNEEFEARYGLFYDELNNDINNSSYADKPLTAENISNAYIEFVENLEKHEPLIDSSLDLAIHEIQHYMKYLHNTDFKLLEDLDAYTEFSGACFTLMKILSNSLALSHSEMIIINHLLSVVPHNSDLYIGLSLLKQYKEDNPESVLQRLNYFLNDLSTDATQNALDILFSNIPGYRVVRLTSCIIYNYLFGPEVSSIMLSTIYAGHFYTLDGVISDLNIELLKIKKGEDGREISEIKSDYKMYYTAMASALALFLENAADLTGIFQSNKRNVLNAYSNSLKNGGLVSYDIHIKYCLDTLNEDVRRGRIDESGLPVMPDDMLNSECINDRLAAVMERHVPNSGVTVDYYFADVGLVKQVLYHVFGIEINGHTYAYRRYELITEENLRMMGKLNGDALTLDATKELLKTAKPGDFVIGAYDAYDHWMTVLEADETGLMVYDAGSNLVNDGLTGFVIRKYHVTYEDIYTAYSSAAEGYTNGIALYRAVNSEYISEDGAEIRYDDSKNFIIEDGVLVEYTGVQPDIIIPEEVTKIGEFAFARNHFIRSVTIPSNVTEIEACAFSDCIGIKEVEFSEGLKIIGDSAFSGCNALGSALLPESLEELGSFAFSDCSYLVTVSVPGSVPVLNGTFYGCKKLKYVTLGEGISKIQYRAFKDCKLLQTISIPDSVTSIGLEIFGNCSSLQSVDLGAGVEYFGSSVFDGCTSLREIYIPASVKSMSGAINIRGTFWGSSIETIILDDSITAIPGGLCSDAQNLKTIDIPDGVTSISDYTFNRCSSLEEIDIPDGVTEIGEGAFMECAKLVTIDLPDSVKLISNDAFAGCKSLESINLGTGLESLGSAVFNGCESLKSLLIPASVKDACGGYFMGTMVGSYLESITFDNDITEIPFGICSGAEHLTSVTIPDGVTKINSYAFENCSSLEEIDIPDGVTEIGKGAFMGCTSLDTIDLPDSVKLISNDAFAGCRSLASINLGTGLESLGSAVFNGCESLKSLHIPASVKEACGGYFMGSMVGSYVESINFDNGINEIPYGICSGAEHLTSVTIPDGVTKINSYAFENCSSLEEITIPENVTSLGKDVFSGADNITVRVYSGSVPHKYCEDVNIPYTLINTDGTTTVNIKVHFSGKIGGADSTVTFTPDSGSPVVVSVPYAAGGNTVTAVLQSGTPYNLNVTKPGHTSYIDRSFVVGTDTLPSLITLYAGDVNADNSINAKDQAAMTEVFGLASTDSKYTVNADFNEDGYINAKDRADILANFGRSGTVIE